ncbi:MAG: ferric reductase-like transmembrane domain-containing protein [Kiritimatiellae bacterium]|jgi:predicted ferric reductase|nr:ferric reductase-like transmembrane domain-containing protein [Kiritimatiellia bacterium]
MKYTYLQAVRWITLYALFVLSPLLLILAGPEQASRGFWIEFGSALGFVGMAMLCAQFLLTGRFRVLAQGFGSDTVLHFHTVTGIAAMCMVFAHPVILLTVHADFRAYLDPSVNLLRVLALVPAMGAVFLVVVLSLGRTLCRLSYELWRVSHGILSVFVVCVGLVHLLQVSHHSSLWWQKGYMGLFTVVAVYSVVQVRVVRPYRMKKRSYTLTEVRKERDGATTLVVDADGHEGMKPKAGQFAWMTVGDSPYALQQNPFSFTSSESSSKRLAFTSKPAGDFTGSWRKMSPGTSVFLDGPYGAFTLKDQSDRGAVFFAGGVGITPIISMLRTLEEQKDSRPCLLFYGSLTWETILFREELEALKESLDLRVLHVLSDPSQEWDGYSGFLTHHILERELPVNLSDYDYYICGPEPMMDLVERELAIKPIPLRQISSERFQIV